MPKADKNKGKGKQPDKESLRSTAGYDLPVCGPGTQIGQFRIEREIGRGGMGVVYLAYDSKLDRQVVQRHLCVLYTLEASQVFDGMMFLSCFFGSGVQMPTYHPTGLIWRLA